MPEQVVLELREYQKKAVDFLIRRRRAVLGSSPRTGKTPVVIQAADHIFTENLASRNALEFHQQIWVIVPANVKRTFAEQIENWSCYGNSIQVIDKRKEEIDPGKIWIVMSYDGARHKLMQLADAREFRPPLIAIMDEAHRVKNFSAKITQATLGATSILKKTRATWLLTGTPFPNKIIDCYALFNFCLYGKLGRYWDFAERHCYIKEIKIHGRRHKKVVGCNKQNLPELTEKVKAILHRDTLDAVWKEMPAIMDEIVTIDHTTKSKELCDGLEEKREEILAAIEAEQDYTPPEVMSLRKQLAIEKIPQAAEFVMDRLADEEPLVVVGRHLDLIHGLKERLKSHCRLAVIEGSTSTKDRDSIRQKFQRGEIDVVLMTIQAGGEGVDFSRSSTMIICEEEWTPKDMEQIKARIVAIGKTIPLRYFYLFFPRSIDKDVHKSIKAKERDIKSFFNVLENRVDDTDFSEIQEHEVEEQINWEY